MSKFVAIVLGAVAVLGLAGFGWKFQESSRLSREATSLSQSLEETTGKLTARESEFATLAQSLEDTRSKLSAREEELRTLAAGGASAGERVAALERAQVALEAQLAKTQESLEAQTQRGNRLDATSSRLESVLKQWNAIETSTVALNEAITTAKEAEIKLVTAPGDINSDELNKSYRALTDTASRTQTLLNELQANIAKSPDEFADHAKTVLATDSNASRLKKTVESVLAGADASKKSLRRSAFAVFADQDWQSSEVSVREGEWAGVAASGQWRWATSLAGSVVGPEGTDSDGGYRMSPWHRNGALLARVRGADVVRSIAEPFAPVDREGRIEFRINDTLIRDNDGKMEVVIYAFKPLIYE